MARPHTGTDDTCRILPSWPLSSTATTTPWNRSLRLTNNFPQIIRHKPPPMKTATAIMTTTREEMAEDNRQEGGGLPGCGIWGGRLKLKNIYLSNRLVLSSPAWPYWRRSIYNPLYNLYLICVKKTEKKEKLVVYFRSSYDLTNFDQFTSVVLHSVLHLII